MDDVTDTVFRQIVASTAAPDLYFTEFVSVDGLQSSGRDRVLPKLHFTGKEQPLIAQIWGLNPDNYEKTAAELVDMGFAGIDINMGCPEKSIVNNGCCSGLINNRDLAIEIIQAVKRGVDGKVPISVKTRLGFNDIDYTWHKLLLEQGIDAITVHCRTRKEMSKVPAHWGDIQPILQLRDQISPQTKIILNGDIETRSQGQELAKTYKVDGLMIGRGVFQDPYCFSESSPWLSLTPEQKKDLYSQHVKLFSETWKQGERKLITLNKFCKTYIHGFDGAKELRDQLMHAKTSEELLELL